MPHGSNGLLISSVPVQQQRGECECGLFVIATALHITAGRGGFIRPDKDAKPPRAVFQDESFLTFSMDKKESQAKYGYKHSHCGRPDSLDIFHILQKRQCHMETV